MTPGQVLLHPVRLRIVQAFLGDRFLTTGQLGALLPGVSTATLYRQVATLVGAGVLEVADERRVRGAAERIYRLRRDASFVGAEAAQFSAQQHREAFATFVVGLLADFDRYLDGGDADLGSDLVSYRQAALYLTDAELQELAGELGEVLSNRMSLSPEGRTRRSLTTILLPSN